MKRRYKSLDDINKAQQELEKAYKSIEDDFLNFGPTSVFSFLLSRDDSSTKSKKDASGKRDNDDTNRGMIVNTLLSLLPTVIPILKDIGLPIMGDQKKLVQKLAKAAISITWKVAAVNVVLWGIKQLRHNNKKKKIARHAAALDRK